MKRITKNNLIGTMKELSEKRKAFVSESDFQLELATLIRETYDVKVRCEYPVIIDGRRKRIDIMIIDKGKWIPIELKYKTKKCYYIDEYTKEKIELVSQYAQDQASYDYIKDIYRIEKIREDYSEFKMGFTIMLTNDMVYKEEKKDTKYKNFSLSIDNPIKGKGLLKWVKGTSEGTKAGRENIALQNDYTFKWEEYSTLGLNKTNDQFEYLINAIK